MSKIVPGVLIHHGHKPVDLIWGYLFIRVLKQMSSRDLPSEAFLKC
jgi:hypothetical protein